MNGASVVGQHSDDRRRNNRVRLKVPVHLSTSAGTGAHGVSTHTYGGETTDMGAGGIFVTTREEGLFLPGDLVRLTIMIPEEARRVVPFSRIVGSARVVRIEQAKLTTGEPGQGIALAFCGDDTTFLGAIMTRR